MYEYMNEYKNAYMYLINPLKKLCLLDISFQNDLADRFSCILSCVHVGFIGSSFGVAVIIVVIFFILLLLPQLLL